MIHSSLSTFKSSAISPHSFSTYTYNIYTQARTIYMALQVVQVNHVPLNKPYVPSSSSSAWKCNKQVVVCVARDYGFSPMVTRNRGLSLKVKCSSDATTTTTTTVTVGQVTDVCKDTFWPIVEAAGDKTVVLDMYTQWCGPCKVIAPKFKELSEKYDDVIFLKLDCNQDNRPLVKELGIKVVPTFKILKNREVVKEVTGAKLDKLVAAIEDVRSS